MAQGCFPQDAFLLHRRHFRETSLLLDVFSREHGVIRLIARGALRAGKRSLGGLLQPFLPLGLAWSLKGEPAVLTSAEATGRLFSLSGTKLYCGFYLNELMLRLLPAHDPHPQMFSYYMQSLARLESGERLDETLRFFELALLEELGYGLMLEHDAESGAEIEPERYYNYRIEQGPVESATGEGAIRGATLTGLREGRLSSPEAIGEAKRLMRRIIHHHLGGRPLKSRELFRWVVQNSANNSREYEG